MRHVGRWVIAGLLAAGGLGGVAFGDHEEGHAHARVTVDELPPAVRSAFEKEAHGGKIEELRTETEGGKTIYEGEVVSNGKGRELEVAEDGSILERSAAHDEASEPEHRERK